MTPYEAILCGNKGEEAKLALVGLLIERGYPGGEWRAEVRPARTWDWVLVMVGTREPGTELVGFWRAYAAGCDALLDMEPVPGPEELAAVIRIPDASPPRNS